MSDSFQTLADYVASGFSVITGRLQTEEDARGFLESLGWIDVPTIPTALLDLQLSLQGIAGARATLFERRLEFTSGEADEASVTAALAVLVGQLALAINDIQRLGAAFEAATPEPYKTESGIASEIEKRIYDTLVFDFFELNFSWVVPVFLLLGIFEETPLDPDPDKHQPAFRFRRVNLDRLLTLLQGPEAVMEEVYGWGTPTLDEERLFANLDRFSKPLLFPTEVRFPTPNFLQAIAPGAVISPDDGPPAMLVLTLAASPSAALELGVVATPKATPAEIQGLGFHLNGSGSFDTTFDIGPGFAITIHAELDLVVGAGAVLRPGGGLSIVTDPDGTPVEFGGGKITGRVSRRRRDEDDAVRLFTIPQAGFIEADELFVEAGVDATSGADIFVKAGLVDGRLVIPTGGNDGFTSKLLPSQDVVVNFDLALGWSQRRGVFFEAAGGLEIAVPVHKTIGPFRVELVRLSIFLDGGGINLTAGVVGSATLGPVTAAVDALGIKADLTFESGNLGPVNLDLGLSLPKGYGIAVDAGAVKGGGFLFLDFDAGRYAGVLELSVFGISVKAFGVIDTKFPDGHKGFSFVIIIIAEFTPIQLGFGFTLLGIGGLVGINRSVDEQGLATAVRTGSLAHVLFPHDPVRDAPAIIHDLTTIFPATEDHFILGPMAKLGWGTPTLITADIGIVIELPGPRIAVLGVLRMQLPDPKAAILRLQMAVAGLIDFPAKRFSLDASLFDSTVAGYVVSGDMAYRLEMGGNTKFLMSVGGFNPGFQAPSPFPDLRRASVDLGVSGNPSLVASGYFALTSNTAQIGASIKLHASGAGIRLDGWLGFDVMFVFSPFSFEASINAGVRVSFHGVGFGINLHGSLSGPNPWHLKGKVCVSVLWWDACLPVDITFGNRQQAALPEIDPWVGETSVPVIGLSAAISDVGNWAGSTPPSEFAVISLAAAATADRTPIDPLGTATLRQKVAPLNRKLEKFGEYKPVGHDIFSLAPGVGSVGVVDPATNLATPVDEIEVVQDDFAPGHFMQLSKAEKLSLPSYELMDAGVAVAADRVALGSSDPKVIEFVTKFIDDDGTVHNDAKHKLTHEQLVGMLKRSPAALGGVRRAGVEKYMLANRPKKIRLGPAQFVVADACTLVRNSAVTGAPVSQTQALLALRSHLGTNASDKGRFTVVPAYAEAA